VFLAPQEHLSEAMVDVLLRLKDVEEVLHRGNDDEGTWNERRNRVQSHLKAVGDIVQEVEKENVTVWLLVACVETMIRMVQHVQGGDGDAALEGVLSLGIFEARRLVVDSRSGTQRNVSQTSNIVTTYRARHPTLADFNVIVVVSSEEIALPRALDDGTVLVVVNYCSTYQPELLPAAEPYGDYIYDTADRGHAEQTLSQHWPRVAAHITNFCGAALAAVRGRWHIVVGVTAKGFIPFGEGMLPKMLGDVPVLVRECRMVPLSLQAWSCEPPQPQVGGAIAPRSLPDRMGTIGPSVTAGAQIAFLTSAHLFRGAAAGESVIAPGRVATALQLLLSGSVKPERFKLLQSQLGSAERAVAHVLATYPAHPAQDQVTIGAAVQIDRACDVAAVVVDGPLSDRGLNWADSYSDQQLSVSLAECWTEADLRTALAHGPVECCGYGARSGLMTGTARRVVPSLVGGCHIAVDRCLCEQGDSGTALCTKTDAGTAKVLGMLAYKHVFEDVARQALLVPAWTLRERVDEWFPAGV
jgi:hypothetical protein